MFDNTTSNSTKQVVAATDAAINMNGVTITRASNTFTDLIEGYEFKLNQTTTSAATVISNLDADLAINVKDFVNVTTVTSTSKRYLKEVLRAKKWCFIKRCWDYINRNKLRHSFSELAGFGQTGRYISELGIKTERWTLALMRQILKNLPLNQFYMM